MKLMLKPLLFLLSSLFIISCSTSSKMEDEIIEEIKLNASDFEIELVGDQVQFNEHTIYVKIIHNNSSVGILKADWYINNTAVSNSNQSQPTLTTSFKDSGNTSIKAIISLTNNQILEINKDVVIKEKSFSTANIYGITINGIEGYALSDFLYKSIGGSTLTSLQSKFIVSNTDDDTVTYISDKNFTNNRTRGFEEISWFTTPTNEFHNMKIYTDGVPEEVFKIDFFGQNIELGRPEQLISTDIVSLNTYRNLKPSTIDLSSGPITYTLYVYWE
ncbi:hypothetical protein [Tenacibaculum agarivorans]|uniref:hypothetical protein n=1 Tax=Tenacibaculum agarivorans TaxID=1908389 RepID=UPI00094B8EF8|nr:hypothetical protein [Tenacibaculum agarivorans]